MNRPPAPAPLADDPAAGPVGFPWAAWIAAAVFLCLLLPKIDAGTLWHHDELLTANRAREMLVRGDPFTVTVNFEPSVKKPPLQYWICAGLLWFLPGYPELAVRLPTLLAGVACLLAAASLARTIPGAQLAGGSGGPWAVLALAGCGYLIHFSRVGLLDTGAALLLTLALVGCRRAGRDARWWWFAALACVLGAWQKAPYGLAAWVVMLAVDRWSGGTAKDGANLGPVGHRWRYHLPAALVAAIVGSAGWWLLQWAHDGHAQLLHAGREQIDGFLRAHDPSDQGFRPWLYWGWMIRDWALPGVCAPFAVLAATLAGRREPEHAALGWTCLVFGGVLAVLPYRAERYLVVITPLLAVLTVDFLSRVPAVYLPVASRRWILSVALASTLPTAIFQYLKPAPAEGDLLVVARELARTQRTGERLLVCADADPDFEVAPFVLFYADLRRALETVDLARVEAVPANVGPCRGICGRSQWDRLHKAQPTFRVVTTTGDWVLWAN